MPLSKAHASARDFIVGEVKKNPNVTAAQVIKAARKARANGEILATVLKLIEVLTPLILAIIKAIS